MVGSSWSQDGSILSQPCVVAVADAFYFPSPTTTKMPDPVDCSLHLIAVDIEVILTILELADYDSVIPSGQSPKDGQIDVTIN